MKHGCMEDVHLTVIKMAKSSKMTQIHNETPLTDAYEKKQTK